MAFAASREWRRVLTRQSWHRRSTKRSTPSSTKSSTFSPTGCGIEFAHCERRSRRNGQITLSEQAYYMRQAIENAPRDATAVILEDDAKGTYDVARWSPEAGEWVGENGEPTK